VTVAAHDTGCGIPPDVIGRVRDPFFTTKGRANASGLGLSMVHGFAGQSGGHLEIESEVSVGTTVRLYFPKFEEESVAAQEIDEPISLAGSESVLLVEDDPAVLDSLTFSLEWYGYTVIMAEDGAKALSVLKESSVEVLITDLSMPGGMGGTKLAQVARKSHPELPVIYITGYAHDISVIVGSRKGDQLLYKLLADDDLAKAVRCALDG
jgi:CheY-like chemotaxis protein